MPTSPFSSFFSVKCVLTFHFVYCNVSVLNDVFCPVNWHARWWSCWCKNCISGLRRLENTLLFWDAYMSWTWRSNVVFFMSFGNPMQLYFLCNGVFVYRLLATSDSFLTRLYYLRKRELLHVERRMSIGPTCRLPALQTFYFLLVKTGKYTCIYAASTSRRIHATARNKARKLRITSHAGCRLTYLQFESDFTRGVIADCLKLLVFLPAVAGNFVCNCGYFCLQIECIFACKTRQFYVPVAGKFAWVSLVSLPVKYPVYSGKFTCGCRRFACLLNEVLAA